MIRSLINRILDGPKCPSWRFGHFIAGVFLLLSTFFLRRSGLFRWAGGRERRANALLVVTVLVVAVFGLEQHLPNRDTSHIGGNRLRLT